MTEDNETETMTKNDIFKLIQSINKDSEDEMEVQFKDLAIPKITYAKI